MKRRRTKLLALALSACLTVTTFSPVFAAGETAVVSAVEEGAALDTTCLLYTSPSPRDRG